MKASLVFVFAVAIATLAPVSMAIAGLGIPNSETAFGFYDGADSRIEDPRGDAQAVLQESNSSIIPDVKDYHDVLGAGVKKLGGSFVFTIELAGNPNMNEKYETNYMWHVLATNATTGQVQHYRVMFPNFAPEFSHAAKGWYYAVYDSTAESYIVPLTKIPDMPEDRVEYSVEDWLIGNPSTFHYWVSVSVRVESDPFTGPPDYLMDYAP